MGRFFNRLASQISAKKEETTKHGTLNVPNFFSNFEKDIVERKRIMALLERERINIEENKKRNEALKIRCIGNLKFYNTKYQSMIQEHIIRI